MNSNKQVFIVDDDVASAESLKALMFVEGLAAQVFHSAESFLSAYDGSSDGCLILDIRLGGMSGLELQNSLVASDSPLVIVIVSGHANEADRRKARSQGAIAVLEKPFPGSHLCKLVREAIIGNCD